MANGHPMTPLILFSCLWVRFERLDNILHLDQSSLDPIKHFQRSSPRHGGVNTNSDDNVDDDYDNDVISD